MPICSYFAIHVWKKKRKKKGGCFTFSSLSPPPLSRPKKKTQALAHSRRQRENDTFTDIAQALPIQENAKDLDKASILRLAIHYLKLRDLIRDGNDEIEGEEGEEGLEGRGELEDLVAGLSPKLKSSEEPSDALVQSM